MRFKELCAQAEDRIDGFSSEWMIIRMSERRPLSSKATSSALPEANKSRDNEGPTMFNGADGCTGHATHMHDLRRRWEGAGRGNRT